MTGAGRRVGLSTLQAVAAVVSMVHAQAVDMLAHRAIELPVLRRDQLAGAAPVQQRPTAPLVVCTSEWEDLDASCAWRNQNASEALDMPEAVQHGPGARLWRGVAESMELKEGVDYVWSHFAGANSLADVLQAVSSTEPTRMCDIAAAAVAQTPERVAGGVSFSSPVTKSRLAVLVADLDAESAWTVGSWMDWFVACSTAIWGPAFVVMVICFCTWGFCSLFPCFCRRCCQCTCRQCLSEVTNRPQLERIIVFGVMCGLPLAPGVLVLVSGFVQEMVAQMANPILVTRLSDLGGQTWYSLPSEICTIPTYVTQLSHVDTYEDDIDDEGDAGNVDAYCPKNIISGDVLVDDGHLHAVARHGWDMNAMMSAFLAPIENVAIGVAAGPIECKAVAADLMTLVSLAERHVPNPPVRLRILHGACALNQLPSDGMSLVFNTNSVDYTTRQKVNNTIQDLRDFDVVECEADLNNTADLFREPDDAPQVGVLSILGLFIMPVLYAFCVSSVYRGLLQPDRERHLHTADAWIASTVAEAVVDAVGDI